MLRNRRTVGIILIIVALAVGGAYYYYGNGSRTQAQQPEETTLATAQVIRGDLTITADGSGTLVPAAEVGLSFPNGGALSEVLVQVGDQVSAGDVLAQVDDADARTALVNAGILLLKAQLDLATAETHLLTVQEGPSDADLASAEAALASAQEAYQQLLDGPDESDIEKLELSLAQAKNSLWSAQLNRDAAGARPDANNYESAQASVANAEISVRKAEMELEALMEPATEAQLADAEARLAQAEENLQELKASPTDDDIDTAEAQLEQARLSLVQAELNLESAQQDLEQTALLAPMGGTVMAVNAQSGDKVSTNAIITLADMDSPLVQFWVEESDLNSVAPGNAVNVVFEALPDYTFSGHILSVDPALVTVSNTPAVQAWASVDLSANPVTLLSGMNAEVEVVAAEARNAVLVPIGALRELGTGQYAVMVVKPDGEMELRPVEVGLKDFVYAEILSGPEVGETISTGTTSSLSSSEPSTQPEPGPGGFMRFLGG
jgi:HlyD family secretion protein